MPLPSINTSTNLGEAFVLYNTGAEKPFVQLIQFLMRNEDSPLSIGQRELLAAFVSALNECTYCAGSHSAVAARFGVHPGLLKELMDDIHTADYDEDFKPILQYIKKLTLSPSKMTQDDIDNGRLIILIGVAPTKPAEFVIFRIAQWSGGSEVSE